MLPSKSSAESRLVRIWRNRGIGACLLFPVSLLFAMASNARRWLYRHGLLSIERVGVPVVVVGNITVGGSGKTPLTLYLALRLRELGRNPGVISRGHAGLSSGVREVLADSDPELVGDEPLLLKRRGAIPVFVGRRRIDAARELLRHYPQCDAILCDDGLQHYALARDFEIAVFDERGVMNGLLLPAGPLREPVDRMRQVDAVVFNGLPQLSPGNSSRFDMRLVAADFYALDNPARRLQATALAGLRLHAVAGIGNPQRFFDLLRGWGLNCLDHPFPDHHRYTAADLAFQGDAILTTEKDAVKFTGLATLPVWVLPVDAWVEPDLARFVLEKLERYHGPAPA